MRKMLLLAVAIVATSTLASAQDPQFQSPRASVTVPAINCDVLTGSPFICVSNGTTRPIFKIACSGEGGFLSSPPVNLSIPHGIIQSGSSTVVDFSPARCNKHIVVFTKDGRQYPFDGFDTKSNTQLLVDNE